MKDASRNAPPGRPVFTVFHTIAIGLSLLFGPLCSAGGLAGNLHPTIREMVGVAPIDHLDPESTALLVVDFQNEYFSGKLPIPDALDALHHTRRLIEFADRHHIRVFHVQHIALAGSSVFALGTTAVDFHPAMEPRAQDVVVQKSGISAFVGTTLDSQLKADDIQTLIVAGLMTHACVAETARDGSRQGYEVVVASDATATRAISAAGKESVSKDELHHSALATIRDTFGDVMSTAQIMALPLR